MTDLLSVDTLFYIAIVLQVLDVATTYHALTAIRGTREANGLMAKVMDRLGLIPTLILKLVIAAAILFWARESDNATIILGAACAVYLLIVGNNIMVIRSGERE